MANMVFYLRNTHENERELLFALDDVQASCEIATANGSFDKNKKEPTIILTNHNGKATLMEFRSDLGNLLHYLKTNYANGLLTSESAMREFCKRTEDIPPVIHNGVPVYGFETHSEQYIYFIGCTPRKGGESTFFIRCYDRQKLIELGYIENNQEV